MLRESFNTIRRKSLSSFVSIHVPHIVKPAKQKLEYPRRRKYKWMSVDVSLKSGKSMYCHKFISRYSDANRSIALV
jgi:hypothetical protein